MCPLGVGTSRSTYTLKTGEAKLWVCLVGVNQYQDDSLSSLRYSAIDCQGLGEALFNATQGFPSKEVMIHHDFSAQPPILDTVRASLQRIVSETQPQDTVIFYFSGHGVLDPNTQQAILCLADTQKDNLLATGMGLQELLQMLGKSSAYQQLICLDACHSGDITLGGARGTMETQQGSASSLLNPTPQFLQVLRERAAQSKGFCALLSCDRGQQSWEFPELGHGVFTYYLIRGLLGEAADSQGVIEADGLYKYVYRQTLQYIEKANQQLRLINQQRRSQGETQLHPEYPLQTPKRIVEGVGELILGLRTASPDAVQPHRRQALVVNGLSGSKISHALSQVLGGAGGFKLEHWPQAGKSWSEVRGAIQASLRRDITSQQESATSFLATTDAGTALLYLRGQIEEIEDGEAWLVLGEGIRFSRSWLRHELRRSSMTQQIVVLDCPGANSLSSWVEDLQLDSERGQCIIAAAATPEEPELFSQVLLETLKAAKPQVGLPISNWITQLQSALAVKGLPLHVWLSGTKGVIEILTGDVNSDLQELEQRELSNSIALHPTEAESHPRLVLGAEHYSQLENLLKRLIGPIAPTLLRKVSVPTLSPNDLVKNLSTHLPPYRRPEFEEAALSLLQSSIQSKTVLNNLPYWNQSIDPDFIRQCEQELANVVGPIASFMIQRTLKPNPQISSTEFVKILAAQIPDPRKALEFQQRVVL
ncbi:MAG: caspase family protein [Chroococcidiopsidaceae cyanobacterium CP_BM_ER_R8_30]|nr:caspase family protein [Chroococcidiopsidaceae cyanobacterium CP_BM_ER_R8_30]